MGWGRREDEGGRRGWGYRPKWHGALLASAASLALSAPGFAQEAAVAERDASEAAQEAQPKVTTLDEITVISRTGESAIETMASVSRLGQEELDRKMATTPLEMLQGVPGVAVQADSSRLSSSVNIRGLQDFGRVAVIVDGARQDFQRSGHGTQSTFWIDPMLVKQVDVIRGPVANTYGSGAIGGVVMFETKDARDFLKEWERYAISFTGQYETNGNGWTMSGTGAARINDNIDVLGNLVWRDYSEYDDGHGDEVSGTGFDVLSGMLKTSIRPNDYSELRLGWIGTDDGWEERSGASDLDLTQNTLTARYALDDPDNPWIDLHINGSWNQAKLDQEYLTDVRQFDPVTGEVINVPAGSKTSYDLDTYGIDLWNTSRFDTGALAHELTYGGDWLKDEVTTSSPLGGSDVYTPSGDRKVWGAYVQDKLTWHWFEVIGALRYDSYELDGTDVDSDGDRLSPRLTVGVSPFEGPVLGGLQVYGTYAEGYRSPTTTETLISGLHPSGVAFPFLPNADLRPETGKTWEFGVNYRRDSLFVADDRLRLKAAYFNNDVDDFIDGQTLSAFDPTSGCPLRPDLLGSPTYAPICFQYQNFAEARLHGFELEAAYDAGWIFGGLTASIIDGWRKADGVKEDIVSIPASQLGGSLGFRLLEQRLSFGGEVEHNIAPDGAEYAKDYTLVNAFARYDVNENFRASLRAENLFDVRYANPLNATTTSVVYEPGLSVKLGATLRFGG
ncbi:TonB-dependent hemoglobin/transferrin/lactoferrin family receptor [Afifella sp. H1R]|uniref:TonB-dependent hemoglobin/transferrin/lactoferrin family receptor n=1 Tax=Afifella sp. H1R TaxID=2908841 RepID=UPI001F3EA132|nr:TonB-dependent hemoglobin/transferrin/lactoferrin family receptor [Afifella sp. H1R]MCF1504687.1 TonB-dependent hemoglobin/transferrin/lactoferrin family receptor [Afifella sp. H1R]